MASEKSATNKKKYVPFELRIVQFVLTHKRLLLFLQLLFVVIFTAGLFFGTKGKAEIYLKLQPFNNGVVTVINCLSDSLLFTVNVYFLLNLHKEGILLHILKRGWSANAKFMSEDRSRMIYITVRAMRVIAIVPIVINIYFLGGLIGTSMYKFYLPRDIWNYSLNMIINSFLFMVYKMKQNFAGINEALIEANQMYLASITVPIFKENISFIKLYTPIKPNVYLERLQEISRYRNALCDSLDLFNKFVKPGLTLIVLCNVVNIFYDLTIIIEFGIKPQVIAGIEIKDFILVIHCMQILAAACQATMLAFIGEHLEGEGQETTRICYAFLNKLPVRPATKTDLLIEKLLSSLLDQSKSRKVILHAGGFFTLNWGILGSITSTVATYSIVIIQFLLK